MMMLMIMMLVTMTMMTVIGNDDDDLFCNHCIMATHLRELHGKYYILQCVTLRSSF